MLFAGDGRFSSDNLTPSLGSVLNDCPNVLLTRGHDVERSVQAGELIFHGDRLDNRSTIDVCVGLHDGSSVLLSPGHALTFDYGICDAMGCINPQALVARRPGITIISYFSRADGSRPGWSGSALRGGTGMLALSAFTVALVEKLQAHNVDFSDFTNDPLSYERLACRNF